VLHCLKIKNRSRRNQKEKETQAAAAAAHGADERKSAAPMIDIRPHVQS